MTRIKIKNENTITGEITMEIAKIRWSYIIIAFQAAMFLVMLNQKIELLRQIDIAESNPIWHSAIVLTVKKVGDYYQPANKYTELFCRWENLNLGIDETPCRFHNYMDLKYFGVNFEHSDTINLSTI